MSSRDNPEVIRSRFARVFAVCIFAVPLLWLCSTNSHSLKVPNFLSCAMLHGKFLTITEVDGTERVL